MKKINFTTAGESHGELLLGILEGIPSNLEINESLDKYIELGNPQGIISFIDKYYGSKLYKVLEKKQF